MENTNDFAALGEDIPDVELVSPASRAFTVPPVQPPPVAELIDVAAPLIHRAEHVKAARRAVEWLQQHGGLTEPPVVKNLGDATGVLVVLLHWVLQREHLAEAARLLWQPTLFEPRPRSVRMIWDAIANHQSVLLQGASSMGKTYTPGVYFFLKWLQDPKFTSVIAVGPTEAHLESNLFTHLVKLHDESALPLPGTTGKLFIGASRRDARAAIRGIPIPLGTSGAGRLQGGKRHPRPVIHPVYGKMSRVFILLDELENIPSGIYKDLENVMSLAGEEPEGFRLVGAYNPKDPSKLPYKLAEPPDGWKKFDIDTDEVWESKRGWYVCRLDAEKSENVVEDRVIYSGLATPEGVRKTTKGAGGENSPGYFTFVRGAYPPGDMTTALIDLHSIEQVVAKVRFQGATHRLGGVDMALEGGDGIEFAAGTYGLASGVEQDGAFIPFLLDGRPILQPALQLDGIYQVPSGPAPAVAADTKAMALGLRIAPDCLCVDRTGNGSGPHDILRSTWNTAVAGVNFFQSCTEAKILDEDDGPASATCHRMDSELAFALREWILYRYAWISPDYDYQELASQLSDRKTYVDRGKRRVESKKEYKRRNAGKSPNKSDAFCLLVHQVRSRFAPLIQSTPTTAGVRAASGEADFLRPVVDPTNALDDLENGEGIF